MSLRIDSSESADVCTVVRLSRWSAVSSLSSTSSVMPMMPFIGVRISWLMLARNSLFARLASIAAIARVDQLLVAGLQLGGARVDRALEVVLLQQQLLIALLDVGQHRVELIDQLADLVVVAVASARTS